MVTADILAQKKSLNITPLSNLYFLPDSKERLPTVLANRHKLGLLSPAGKENGYGA